MKIWLSGLVILSVITLWVTFFRTDPAEEATKQGELSTRDLGRRSEQRNLGVKENFLLGSNFDYDTAVDLIHRPGDPFPSVLLSPEIFSEQYKTILADKNLSLRDRNTKLQLLVKAYVIKNGIGPSLKGVNQYFGAGRIRSEILGNLFRYAESDQGTLYQLIPSLAEGAEQEFAFSGIVSRIPLQGFIDSALFEFFPLPETMANTFSDSFVPLVMRNQLSIEQGIELMTKAFGTEVSQERLTNYFRRLLDSDSDRIVEYCLSEISPSSVRDTILKTHLSREIVRSPERGMTELLEMRKSHPDVVEGELFTHAMAEFLKADREQALQWFDDVHHGLPADQRGSLQGAIALNTFAEGEIQSAWDRLDQISDPEIREKFERRIWAQESKIVNEKASRDPKGFVENIASGESPHADYWIKQGFSAWHEADAEQANSWYSENQSRLRPAQNQHVARAYAEVALGEGDINLARQWSEQVVDPKFKQKLVEQINAVVEKAQ